MQTKKKNTNNNNWLQIALCLQHTLLLTGKKGACRLWRSIWQKQAKFWVANAMQAKQVCLQIQICVIKFRQARWVSHYITNRMRTRNTLNMNFCKLHLFFWVSSDQVNLVSLRWVLHEANVQNCFRKLNNAIVFCFLEANLVENEWLAETKYTHKQIHKYTNQLAQTSHTIVVAR